MEQPIVPEVDEQGRQIKYAKRVCYVKKNGEQRTYQQRYYVSGAPVGRRKEPITDIKEMYKGMSKEKRKFLLECCKNLDMLLEKRDELFPEEVAKTLLEHQ